VLGAAVAGIGWIGMYVGVSYFFGAEIARRKQPLRSRVPGGRRA
jgi:hypothetical protein